MIHLSSDQKLFIPSSPNVLGMVIREKIIEKNIHRWPIILRLTPTYVYTVHMLTHFLHCTYMSIKVCRTTCGIIANATIQWRRVNLFNWHTWFKTINLLSRWGSKWNHYTTIFIILFLWKNFLYDLVIDVQNWAR